MKSHSHLQLSNSPVKRPLSGKKSTRILTMDYTMSKLQTCFMAVESRMDASVNLCMALLSSIFTVAKAWWRKGRKTQHGYDVTYQMYHVLQTLEVHLPLTL